MPVSPSRVVARYLSAASARLPPKTKTSTNLALIRAGMDGNGRFHSPGAALTVASKVLEENGLELGEVINGFPLSLPKGQMNLDIAVSNPDDPFSPTTVGKSSLAIQWYKLDGGMYEIVAYLS